MERNIVLTPINDLCCSGTHKKCVLEREGGGAEASGQHFSPEKQKASVTQEIGWKAIIRPISHFIIFFRKVL